MFLTFFEFIFCRKHASLKTVPVSSTKPSKKTSSHLEHLKDIRVPPIPSIDDSDEDTTSSTLMLPAPIRRGRGRPKKTPPVLEPCVPFNSLSPSKRVHTSDRSDIKSRKQHSKNRKESESSDQSEERCDKTLKYSTHRSRSREVQVTSQGVQCDQSEFPVFELFGSKKKKKNQACQSYDLSEKSTNIIKASSHHVAKEKGKCHQKLGTLPTVCDRVKKSHDICTYKQSSKSLSKSSSSHSSKDTGFVKSSSHRKQDSSSSSRNRSSSSSKRRAPSGTEKKKRDLSEAPAARLAAAAAAIFASSSNILIKQEIPSANTQPAVAANVRIGKPQRPSSSVNVSIKQEAPIANTQPALTASVRPAKPQRPSSSTNISVKQETSNANTQSAVAVGVRPGKPQRPHDVRFACSFHVSRTFILLFEMF